MGLARLARVFLVGDTLRPRGGHVLWGDDDLVCQPLFGLGAQGPHLFQAVQWVHVFVPRCGGFFGGGKVELGLPSHQHGGLGRTARCARVHPRQETGPTFRVVFAHRLLVFFC